MALSPLRKQIFKVAVYTSILIWALFVTGHTIFEGWKPLFFKISVVIPSFILVVWFVNIALIGISQRYLKDKQARYFRYILSYVICIAIVTFSRVLILYMMAGHEEETEHVTQINSEDNGLRATSATFALGLVINTIILLIQDLIMLRDTKATVELENADLKIRNIEVTYQQLKQQIHPHFLFNSLSTLKSMIRKQPDNAEDYVVKLSDFLRASLLSGTPRTVVLSEELKLCNDYLAMQKLRFSDSLQYTIHIPQEIQDVACVPVFSLLSLLENAVKHNNFTAESPLRIQMHYVRGRIITSNNIQRKISVEVSTRLGLANLTERYRILGGDDVVVGNDGTTFFVSMGTLSNENSYHRG